MIRLSRHFQRALGEKGEKERRRRINTTAGSYGPKKPTEGK